MPSPTDNTRPTSAISASPPKFAICSSGSPKFQPHEYPSRNTLHSCFKPIKFVLIDVSIIREPMRTTRPPIRDGSTRIRKSLSLSARHQRLLQRRRPRLSSATAEITAEISPRRRACSSRNALIIRSMACSRPFAATVPANFTVSASAWPFQDRCDCIHLLNPRNCWRANHELNIRIFRDKWPNLSDPQRPALFTSIICQCGQCTCITTSKTFRA